MKPNETTAILVNHHQNEVVQSVNGSGDSVDDADDGYALNENVEEDEDESTSSQNVEDAEDSRDQMTNAIQDEDEDEDSDDEKFSFIFGCCGKSKRSQAPITQRSFQLDKGNYGDDVGFQCETHQNIYFGIADGVSGNRKKGIDAKLFPLALTTTCKQLLLKNLGKNENLFDLLCKSHQFVQQSKIYGSSTICLSSISKLNGKLSTLNLGDSGYLIIRNKAVIFKSQPQTHRYNAPYQLACIPPCSTSTIHLSENLIYRDMPEDSIHLTHRLEFGDYLLLSTDGLFDNLYEDEIAMVLNQFLDKSVVTKDLLNQACELLIERAGQANIKRDDILIILIYICDVNDENRTININSTGSTTEDNDTSLGN